MADIDVNSIILSLESTAVKTAVSEIVAYLAANVWAGFALSFVSPIVGWMVGIIVGILITRLDWLSYMLVENWENTQEAKDFENAALASRNPPPNATPEELKALEQAQIDAFRRLVSLGSTP